MRNKHSEITKKVNRKGSSTSTPLREASSISTQEHDVTLIECQWLLDYCVSLVNSVIAYSLSKKKKRQLNANLRKPRKLVPSKKNKSLTIAQISSCKIKNIVISVSRKNLVFHGIDMFVGWEDRLAKICDRAAFLNRKIT